MAQISSSQATSIIESMLDLLYEKDNFLLQRKLNITERAGTHRMGMYLQQLLPDLHVDCEYNRMGKKPSTGLNIRTAIILRKQSVFLKGVYLMMMMKVPGYFPIL